MSDEEDIQNKRKRALLACRRCRQKKVKCGSQFPQCTRCQVQHLDCIYDVEAPFVNGVEDVKDLIQTIHKMESQIKVLESDFQSHQAMADRVNTNTSITLLSPVSEVSKDDDWGRNSVGRESDVPKNGHKRQRSESNVTHSSIDDSGYYSDVNCSPVKLKDSCCPISVSHSAETLRMIFSNNGLGIETSPTSLTEFYTTVLNSLTKFGVDKELKDIVDKQEEFLEHVTIPKKTSYPVFGESPMTEHSMASELRDISLHSSAAKKQIISQILIDRLIDLYFECYNRQSPLIVQDEFMRAYRQNSANTLLVNAICAFTINHSFRLHDGLPVSGYEHCDIDMSKDIGELFYNRARVILTDCFDEPKLEHVQALILCADYEITVWGPQRAQLLHSMAVRMLLDIDAHRKIKGDSGNLANLDNMLEREALRRVFWVVYLTDFQFAYDTGFPTMIDDADCEGIALPATLPTDDIETKGAVAYFAQHIRLTRIRKMIYQKIYVKSSEVPFSTISTLERTLTAFYDSLPNPMKYNHNKHYPRTSSWLKNSLILNLEYHLCWIELHRPFVPDLEKQYFTTEMDALSLDPLPFLSLHISTAAASSATSIMQLLVDHSACPSDLRAASTVSAIHLINLQLPNTAIRSAAQNNLAMILRFVRCSGGFWGGLKGHVAFANRLERTLGLWEAGEECETVDWSRLVRSYCVDSQSDSDLSTFQDDLSVKGDFEWIDDSSDHESNDT
ncbi:fungal-specific transcription factor domain-containing protein [Endogone sp. FLAS-F59071]|nr:fungal-specific transcription factor domain-containing protein [Endogone sp. FLAS-F59071]|eukprot:RUS18064.1 fungal-specific transcription factor domain-containing protein [Endogone sp. FLAS-F59071]